jgi:hypothetical protein
VIDLKTLTTIKNQIDKIEREYPDKYEEDKKRFNELKVASVLNCLEKDLSESLNIIKLFGKEDWNKILKTIEEKYPKKYEKIAKEIYKE